jgi:hypothetical protein
MASKPTVQGPSISSPSVFHLQNNWNGRPNNGCRDDNRSLRAVLKHGSK